MDFHDRQKYEKEVEDYAKKLLIAREKLRWELTHHSGSDRIEFAADVVSSMETHKLLRELNALLGQLKEKTKC